jgi:two-component system sensor histidine kinase GlrK
MLIGFTIVAAPLLFAIVNAAVQMNRLSIRSQQLVVHGMQGARNNQRMFEEIGALERQAKLYQIIGSADLLDVYARHHARLATAIHELLKLPLDEESQQGARAVEERADQLLENLKHAAPNSAHMAELIGTFPQLAEAASRV